MSALLLSPKILPLGNWERAEQTQALRPRLNYLTKAVRIFQNPKNIGALPSFKKRMLASVGQQKARERREVKCIPDDEANDRVLVRLTEEASIHHKKYRAERLGWLLSAATTASGSLDGDHIYFRNSSASSSRASGSSSSSGNNNSSSSAGAVLARTFGAQEDRRVLPAAAAPISYLRTKYRDPSIVSQRQSEFALLYHAREKLLAGEGEEVPEGVAPPVITHSCTTTGVNGDVFHHVRSDIYGIPYTKTTCVMPFDGSKLELITTDDGLKLPSYK